MKNFKKFSGVLLVIVIAISLASCGKKVPLSEDQKVFAGKWTAADGTFVHIYFDGGGDLKTSNSNITGGKAIIAEDSLTVALGPIKKKK